MRLMRQVLPSAKLQSSKTAATFLLSHIALGDRCPPVPSPVHEPPMILCETLLERSWRWEPRRVYAPGLRTETIQIADAASSASLATGDAARISAIDNSVIDAAGSRTLTAA
jgi:hypothetical protein